MIAAAGPWILHAGVQNPPVQIWLWFTSSNGRRTPSIRLEENEERHKRREEEVARANQSVLVPALKRVKEAGIEGNGLVRHGNVGDVLNDLATEFQADQIIVGRIGESGLKSLLFGSVTTKLIQLSNAPVTVVP